MSFAGRRTASGAREIEFTPVEIIGRFGMSDSGAHKELVYGHWTGMTDDYYIINVKATGAYSKGVHMSGEELDELTEILIKNQNKAAHNEVS